MVIKFLFKWDDDTLEVSLRLLLYVLRNLADVGVIQGSVNLIQNKEGRWSIAEKQNKIEKDNTGHKSE